MVRISKAIAATLLSLVVLSIFHISDAYAQTAPVTCTITGPEALPDFPNCEPVNGAVWGPPPEYADYVYWMARSTTNTNGKLTYPIDAHEICRYIDNISASSRDYVNIGYMIPFKTKPEWTAFIKTNSDAANSLIYAVPCARPKDDVDTNVIGPDSKKILVDVPIYGFPRIEERESTHEVNDYTPPAVVFPHTRSDCNDYGICNVFTWDETYTFKCTPVLDAANNNENHDAGKWSCVMVSHDNPVPPIDPPLPQSCGDNPDGSIYWINVTGDGATGSRPAKVPEECEFGVGTRKLVWDNQIQVECQNGNEVATGETREVNERWEGECALEPEPTCLFLSQEDPGYVERLKSECCVVPANLKICQETPKTPNPLPATLAADTTMTVTGGHNKIDIYSCTPVSSTGTQSIYGFALSSTSGACEPAMCGDQPSGSTYWKTTGTRQETEPATVDQCPNGGTVTYTITTQAEYQCYDGVETATGKTREQKSDPVVVCDEEEPKCLFKANNTAGYVERKKAECCIVPDDLEICESEPTGVPSTIPADTVLTLSGGYSRVETYSCTPVSSTGTRAIYDFVLSSFGGVCEAGMCGDQPHGSVYYKVIGTETTTRDATTEECQYGGIATLTWNIEREYICTNGEDIPTGSPDKKVLVNTTLSCNQPASCYGYPHGTTAWLETGTKTKSRAATAEECPYGGTAVDTIKVEELFICNNGVVENTGTTPRETIIKTDLSCNQPASCGNNPHGSYYYKAAGTVSDTRNAYENECPYGGTATVTWSVEKLYYCDNGAENYVSGYDKYTVINTQLNCSQPASCYGYPHGTTAWLETGTKTKTRKATSSECPYGGTAVDTIKIEEQYICLNGVVSNTGAGPRETVVDTKLTCSGPASCGSHASGSTYWKTTGTTTETRTATASECLYGGTTTVTYTKEAEYQCYDGKETATGQTKKTETGKSSTCNPIPPGGGGDGGGGDGGGGDGGGGDGGGG